MLSPVQVDAAPAAPLQDVAAPQAPLAKHMTWARLRRRFFSSIAKVKAKRVFLSLLSAVRRRAMLAVHGAVVVHTLVPADARPGYQLRVRLPSGKMVVVALPP